MFDRELVAALEQKPNSSYFLLPTSHPPLLFLPSSFPPFFSPLLLLRFFSRSSFHRPLQFLLSSISCLISYDSISAIPSSSSFLLLGLQSWWSRINHFLMYINNIRPREHGRRDSKTIALSDSASSAPPLRLSRYFVLLFLYFSLPPSFSFPGIVESASGRNV